MLFHFMRYGRNDQVIELRARRGTERIQLSLSEARQVAGLHAPSPDMIPGERAGNHILMEYRRYELGIIDVYWCDSRLARAQPVGIAQNGNKHLNVVSMRDRRSQRSKTGKKAITSPTSKKANGHWAKCVRLPFSFLLRAFFELERPGRQAPFNEPNSFESLAV